MNHSFIFNCLNCNKSLRVPTDKGKLKITCPHCKYESLFEGGAIIKLESSPLIKSNVNSVSTERSVDIRTLNFRCSKTGGRFYVNFSRLHKEHEFRIVSCSTDSGELSKKYSNIDTTSQLKFSETKNQSFDANDFNLSGFECPCCQYAGDPSFVNCSTCGELVCGYSVVHVSPTVATFECHKDCSGGGVLNKGTIKNYSGKSSKIESGKAHLSNDKKKIERDIKTNLRLS